MSPFTKTILVEVTLSPYDATCSTPTRNAAQVDRAVRNDLEALYCFQFDAGDEGLGIASLRAYRG
eukprot:SAG31_NODE_10177_length_1175_cov_0.895911_2_plen_65_part_00